MGSGLGDSGFFPHRRHELPEVLERMGADQGIAAGDEGGHGAHPYVMGLLELGEDLAVVAAILQGGSKTVWIQAELSRDLGQHLCGADIPVFDEIGAIDSTAESITLALLGCPFGGLVSGGGVVAVVSFTVLEAGFVG